MRKLRNAGSPGLAAACALAIWPLGTGVARADLPEGAVSGKQLVQTSGVRGGLIVHLGCGDGRLTAELLGFPEAKDRVEAAPSTGPAGPGQVLGRAGHPSAGARPAFLVHGLDAARRFDLPAGDAYELPGCRCGQVITGRCLPPDCPLFGTACTPRSPVGPCMVSSEGACAAWYKYQRR